MNEMRRHLHSLISFLSLLVFIFSLLITNASALNLMKARDADVNFITLADIHFDPFASCLNIPCPIIEKLRNASSVKWYEILSADDRTQPAYGKDTNIVLLKNALEAAKEAAIQHHAKFVLVLGDSLGTNIGGTIRNSQVINLKRVINCLLKNPWSFYQRNYQQLFQQSVFIQW